MEFRFYSENRQNSVIDRCLGAILRTSAADEVISMVKLDRPVIYDEFIESERKKLDDLKEAYLNGLLTDEELTTRVGMSTTESGSWRILTIKIRSTCPFTT